MPRARPAIAETDEDDESAKLDRVFFALSDPTRRDILQRLGEERLLVSEIADAYAMSLQAVSRHVQILACAGLVRQERSGRVSPCSLEVGPLYSAAVWLNGYSRYWQAQFDALKSWLERDAVRRGRPVRNGAKRRRTSSGESNEI
ncbi:MAG: ArsR/SmtB family transcription factor [Amphiplicatus sp.]